MIPPIAERETHDQMLERQSGSAMLVELKESTVSLLRRAPMIFAGGTKPL